MIAVTSLALWLSEATMRLTAGGNACAAADARRLACDGLAITAAQLIGDPARGLSHVQVAMLDARLARRLAHEPVSRIAGEREFYGRPFTITPDVLDPRADTETVVDAVLELANSAPWHDRALSILDLGTGSGAILLTLLAELPHATGIGLDISPAALACAERNAERLGLTPHARFHHGDMRQDLKGLGSFDIVVSNPPYIPSAAIAALDPDVAAYDPHLALDGGRDGLAFYRAILAAWAADDPAGRAPRALVLELGWGQHDAVADIARSLLGLRVSRAPTVRSDIAGRPRALMITTQTAGVP